MNGVPVGLATTAVIRIVAVLAAQSDMSIEQVVEVLRVHHANVVETMATSDDILAQINTSARGTA
jgi:hypothetical protein